MTGNNPTDRSKLGTKRHILTDKEGIPLSAVISSASTHDIKLVIDMVDNSVIKKPLSSSKPKSRRKGRRRRLQHLCLDKAYNSIQEEQELIKRGYVLHISPKRKRGRKRGGAQYGNATFLKPEKTFCKKMGCGKDKLMAQQVQKTVHTI